MRDDKKISNIIKSIFYIFLASVLMNFLAVLVFFLKWLGYY